MNNRKKVLDFIINQKIFIVLILLIIILTFTTGTFLTKANLINILFQITVEGIIAIGMTYVLIIRELDLSVGSNMALAISFIIIFLRYGIVVGILAGLFISTLIGLINGLIVTKLKINSIATTLGMSIIIRGAVYWLTESRTIKGNNNTFPIISNGTLFSIPYPVYVFLLFLVLFGLILSRSFFGRNLYVIGGNPIAAEYFGIKVDKNKLFTFLLTGFLVGISGVVLASKINIASAQLGIDTPLNIITAVLLGGISLSGGEGNIVKTFQGVLLIGVISNALVLLKIEPFYHSVIKGLLLVIVLTIDAIYIRTQKYRFEM